MNYYICEGNSREEYNASIKAREDVEKILNNQNFKKLFIPAKSGIVHNKILKIIQYFNYYANKKMWKKVLNTLTPKDTIIIQYPIIYTTIGLEKVIRKIKKKGITVICLIHDLDSLRYQIGMQSRLLIERIKREDKKVLNACSSIIAHNEKMKNSMIQNGISEEKIYILELFDYLCEESIISEKIEDKEIVYAGNLMKEKSPFIYQLEEEKLKFEFNLYGKGILKDISKKIKYKGAFLPDELPSKMKGRLGLVWDGNWDESDENDGFKNYTKYNNPHKLSCYIAAGLPVIVWRKAAVADFVTKYDIGYTIGHIYDINNIDLRNYETKRNNLLKLKEKLIKGYYTKRVIKQILNEDEIKVNMGE